MIKINLWIVDDLCFITKGFDVGIDRILVHDAHNPFPSLAFALSRLNTKAGVPSPTINFSSRL